MRARHPDTDLLQQGVQAAQVLGKGSLHEGPAAEDDQGQPFALSGSDEGADDVFDRIQPLQARAVRANEVALVHRAGDIDGQDDVACGLRRLNWFAQPLRPS